MRPKGKLLVLVVMFAAVGVITATGAFTTVEAERTATVDVAGDSAALLQLEAADGAEHLVDDENGAIEITLNDLNPEANTTFNPLVNITNNAQHDIDITVTVDNVEGDAVNVAVLNGEHNGLSVGQSEAFGLEIETFGEESEFDITLSIEANQSE